MARSNLLLVACVVAVLALGAQVAVAQDAAAAEGSGCPFTLTLPWTYDNETVVDLSEKVEVEGEDNPLAVTTVCTCPVVTEAPTICTCEGPKSDDCDTYAEILSTFFLFTEKFMVSRNPLPPLSSASLQNVGVSLRASWQRRRTYGRFEQDRWRTRKLSGPGGGAGESMAGLLQAGFERKGGGGQRRERIGDECSLFRWQGSSVGPGLVQRRAG